MSIVKIKHQFRGWRALALIFAASLLAIPFSLFTLNAKLAGAQSAGSAYLNYDINDYADLDTYPRLLDDGTNSREVKLWKDDDTWLFCIQAHVEFFPGYADGTYVEGEQYKQIALFRYWAENFYDGSGDRYFIAQLGIWSIVGDIETSNYDGVNIANVMPGFWNWYEENGWKYDYQVVLWEKSGSQRAVTTKAWISTGKIDLQKASTDAKFVDSLDVYKLEGAEYGIYHSEADALAGVQNGNDKRIQTLTTSNNGFAVSDDILFGEYFVKETKAPAGHLLDSNVYRVVVEKNMTTRVSASIDGGIVYDPGNLSDDVRNNLEENAKVKDEVAFDSTFIKIAKFDGEREYSAENLPQGSASLEGALYKVCYYENCEGKVAGSPTAFWVFKTNSLGLIDLSNPAEFKTSGYDFYYHEGKIVFPIGTYTAQEIKAPEGYLLNGTMCERVIIKMNSESTGITRSVNADSTVRFSEQVVRGGVAMYKLDAETGLSASIGNTTFDGTTFDIYTDNDHEVKVDDRFYSKGSKVASITVKDGKAATASNTLPRGNYHIVESHAADGYFSSDKVWNFEIVENGKIVEPTKDQAIYNQVKRSDFSFTKKDDVDQHPLANIPFVVESKTTGEQHVVVTDENGYVNSAASWNPHTQNTNANDAVLARNEAGKFTKNDDGEYSAITDEYTKEAGVWFSSNTPGAAMYSFNGTTWGSNTAAGETSTPSDTLGALPYDTYTITEVRCEANKNRLLIPTFELTITRDRANYEVGTIVDKEKTEIALLTNAADAFDGDKTVIADENSSIVDSINYFGLEIGAEYTLRTKLVNKTKGECLTIDGLEILAEKTFTAATTSGTKQVEFTIDTSTLDAGTELVVFEYLYRDGSIVAKHEDLEDDGQTVTIITPEISTTALEAEDGDKEISRDTQSTIVDDIAYKNLIPGREYTLHTSVHNEAGEEISLTNGATTLESKFTPESSNGTTSANISLDTTKLSDESLVLFEELYLGERLCASHCDATDENQTVKLVSPAISTFAKDGTDGDKTLVRSKNMVVVDAISYENLNANKEYKLVGKLLYKSDDAEPAQIATSELNFIPNETNGTVDATFLFDGMQLTGNETLVVFEELYREDTLVAEHSDIDDEDQTITVANPEIKTSASDKQDGDRFVQQENEVTICDVVSYSNVIPGKTYTVSGILMNKYEMAPVLQNDQAITSTTEFTPSEQQGATTLEFTLSTEDFEDEDELVIFEKLFEDDVELANHEDFENLDQTITIDEPPDEPGELIETGDKMAVIIVLTAITALTIAVVISIDRRKPRKKNSNLKDILISELPRW